MQHPKLVADYVLANPPFNVSDWWNEKLEGDPRWQFGKPPKGNANFAWLQHILYHLKPAGRAGVVLANGSMSSSQNNEGAIRRAMIEADAIDCMVALPPTAFLQHSDSGLPLVSRQRQTSRRARPSRRDAFH